MDSKLGFPPWPESVLIFYVLLMVSMSLSSFHRWKIKSHIIVMLWESWNNIYSNWTVIREKHIMNLIPFPDVKCHKEFFFILGKITGIFETILFSLVYVCLQVGIRVFHTECVINAMCCSFTDIKLLKAPHSARRCMTFIEIEGKCVWLMVEFGVFSKQELRSIWGGFKPM